MRFINMSLKCFDQMVEHRPVITANESVRRILHAVQKVIPKSSSSSSHSAVAVPPLSTCPMADMSITMKQQGPAPAPAPLAPMNNEPGSPAATATPGTDQSSPWTAELNPNIRFPALDNGAATDIGASHGGVGGGSAGQGTPATPNDLIFFGDWVVGRQGVQGATTMQGGGQEEQAAFGSPHATEDSQQQQELSAWGVDVGNWGVMTTDLYNWFPSDMNNFMQ
jgi:hypothetical protein